MWFLCKQTPLDTPRQVLRNARRLLRTELYITKSLYTRALVQSQSANKIPREPSLSGLEMFDFSTGLMSLNHMLQRPKTDLERWQMIFGGDLIVP